jgi:hypothetical protein
MSMTKAHSKSRQQAEIAFGKAQSQPNPEAKEPDSVVLERQEKTLRLREARLAKELQDCAGSTTRPHRERTRKT